ncbi:unnamed protein product, partial [Bubo scandiacus]
KPCRRDHVHRRADATRGEEEGVSGKQMGSTLICGRAEPSAFGVLSIGYFQGHAT